MKPELFIIQDERSTRALVGWDTQRLSWKDVKQLSPTAVRFSDLAVADPYHGTQILTANGVLYRVDPEHVVWRGYPEDRVPDAYRSADPLGPFTAAEGYVP